MTNDSSSVFLSKAGPQHWLPIAKKTCLERTDGARDDVATEDPWEILPRAGGIPESRPLEMARGMGAAAVFPPGTVIAEAAQELLRTLSSRLGH